MAFDRAAAARSLVTVLPGGRGRGMGFRLLDDLLVTACHCLPRSGGGVKLPDPFKARGSVVTVRVRAFAGSTQEVPATVIAADPCADIALLSCRTLGGGAPSRTVMEDFDALLDQLEACSPEMEPATGSKVYIHTHLRTWVTGRVKHSLIELTDPAARIVGGTSGAPVFSESGTVVGLVSTGNAGVAQATICRLADHLPGWVLRDAACQLK